MAVGPCQPPFLFVATATVPMYIPTMTNTMEATSEIYRNGRALMSYVYMDGKLGGRAKIIIVRAEKDYEGIAVYEDGSMMTMWSNKKASLMTSMKREVKKRLDNR
jgi:hypothetical protein